MRHNHTMPVDLPAALRELGQLQRWVVWRREVDRRGRPVKVPYDPYRPQRRARVNDPRTWSDLAGALRALESGEYDGIGLVLPPGLIGVDLDDCALDPGRRIVSIDDLQPAAAGMVRELATYTEISPSGRGCKALLHAPHSPTQRRRWPLRGVEIYDAASPRFFALTGELLVGASTQIRSDPGAAAALAAVVESLDASIAARPRRAGDASSTPASAGDLAGYDWAAIDAARPALRELIRPNGIPIGVREGSQTWVALAEGAAALVERWPALRGWIERADGSTDESMIRAVVMVGLRTFAGYCWPAAGAVFWELFHTHARRPGRGRRWMQQEIARLWDKARPPLRGDNPAVLRALERAGRGGGTETHVSARADLPAAAADLPAVVRRPAGSARPGRQRALGAEQYLEWLRQRADAHESIVVLSATQIAAALGVTRRTILRYESQLRAAGRLERRAIGRRQHGCVILRGDHSAAQSAPAAAGDVVIVQQHDRVATADSACSSANMEHGVSCPAPAGQLDPAGPGRQLDPATAPAPARPRPRPASSTPAPAAGEARSAPAAGQLDPATAPAPARPRPRPASSTPAPAAGEARSAPAAGQLDPAAAPAPARPGGRPRPASSTPPAPAASSTPPAPAASSTPAADLPGLVADAIDAYGLNLRRVRRYVRDNGGSEYAPEAVAYWYGRARRAARVRSMDARTADRQRRAAERQIARAMRLRPRNPDQRPAWERARRAMPYWQWLHAACCERLAELQPPRRPAAPHVPDPRVVELYERLEAPPSVFPPAPISAPVAVSPARALIDSLYRLRAGRLAEGQQPLDLGDLAEGQQPLDLGDLAAAPCARL